MRSYRNRHLQHIEGEDLDVIMTMSNTYTLLDDRDEVLLSSQNNAQNNANEEDVCWSTLSTTLVGLCLTNDEPFPFSGVFQALRSILSKLVSPAHICGNLDGSCIHERCVFSFNLWKGSERENNCVASKENLKSLE